MGMDPLTLMAGAALLGAGVSYANGQQQKEATEKASRQAQQNAAKMAADADQANNRANQKKPDTSAILSAAQQSGKAGASGTLLTGPQGVDLNALTLGKNVLLGQ